MTFWEKKYIASIVQASISQNMIDTWRRLKLKVKQLKLYNKKQTTKIKNFVQMRQKIINKKKLHTMKNSIENN